MDERSAGPCANRDALQLANNCLDGNAHGDPVPDYYPVRDSDVVGNINCHTTTSHGNAVDRSGTQRNRFRYEDALASYGYGDGYRGGDDTRDIHGITNAECRDLTRRPL